jgi:hypothetical protein
MLKNLENRAEFCPVLYTLAGFFTDPLQQRLQAERMRSSRVVNDCQFVRVLCVLDPTLHRLTSFVGEAYTNSEQPTIKNQKWRMMANNEEKRTLWHRALQEQVLKNYYLYLFYFIIFIYIIFYLFK